MKSMNRFEINVKFFDSVDKRKRLQMVCEYPSVLHAIFTVPQAFFNFPHLNDMPTVFEVAIQLPNYRWKNLKIICSLLAQ